MVEAVLQPRGPYALALSARGDATRRFRDGLLTVALPEGRAVAWQRTDRRVVVSAPSDQAVERMRFVLALDDDHTPFLRLHRRDPLLRHVIGTLPGLRPLRLATVAHSLLRAFCGQLISVREAREIEWQIITAACSRHDGLRTPPKAADLVRLSPAKMRSLGLHARRGAALVRICGSFDPERLKEVPTAVVAERLERERGLGPWSVGVVCLNGLGRFERGLVGDLGLIKLCAALWGRWVEGWETAELLEPYGEWQGLASVYLMTGFARGLIPGAVHSLGGVRQSAIGGPRRGEDRRVPDRGLAPLRMARAI